MGPEKSLILIVDDVPGNLQVLGNMLRKKSYSVSAATNGGQALEMLEKIEPDLIMLDVMMPGMDGFEVCTLLKKADRTKDIPVIFLTARTQTEDLVKGFESGAVDYVTKPFNKAELLARVDTHVQLKKAQKEIIRLEQKNTAMAMAVTANHEINQPLTILQGNFEIYQTSIQNQTLTDKQKRSLDKMQTAVHRIEEILKKYMDAVSVEMETYVGRQKQIIFHPNDPDREEA